MNQSSEPQPNPTPSPTPTPQTQEGILNLSVLNNLEYYHSYCKVPLKLTDGVFGGSENFLCNQERPSGFLFRIYNAKAAFGDLDLDGKDDAALILSTNYGGSGDFRELAVVLNQNGVLKHVTSAELGDRTIINEISIQDSRIVLDMVTHGPEDGACCPTQKVSSEFRFDVEQNKIIKVQ